MKTVFYKVFKGCTEKYIYTIIMYNKIQKTYILNKGNYTEDKKHWYNENKIICLEFLELFQHKFNPIKLYMTLTTDGQINQLKNITFLVVLTFTTKVLIIIS